MEYKFFPKALAVATARIAVMAVVPKRMVEPKLVLKMSAALKAYGIAIVDYEAAAANQQHQKFLQHLLKIEVPLFTETVSAFISAMSVKLQEHLKVAVHLAVDNSLVFGKVNCKDAQELKQAWSPVVNMWAAMEDAMTEINIPKIKFVQLDKAKRACCYEEAAANYNLVRNRICDISAARALARPETSTENRQAMIQKARAVIDKLGGTLGTCIGLVFSAAEKP